MNRGRGGPAYQNYQNGAGSYDRRPSPSNSYGGGGAYGYNNTANAPPPVNGYGGYGPGGSDLPRAESPPSLSNAGPQRGPISEMDATATNPSTTHLSTIRDSDTDIVGMVGLQSQGHPTDRTTDSYMSDGSKYSTDE